MSTGDVGVKLKAWPNRPRSRTDHGFRPPAAKMEAAVTDSAVDQAVRQLARGGIVVVVDDEDRENEGDLIMAAEHATPEKVAFFLRHTSGFLCTAITEQRAAELGLDLMVQDNTESHRTAFLGSV